MLKFYSVFLPFIDPNLEVNFHYTILYLSQVIFLTIEGS